MMKRIAYLMTFVLLVLNGICADAQLQAYPEDMLNFEYPYFTTVKFEGNSPDIADFVTSLINEENMIMDSGVFIDAWTHYLRHEPQEPGSEINVDKKNGYVSMTSENSDEFEGDVRLYKNFYEMCYWNCADGKHKVFAVNLNTMMNDRYYDGQTNGLSFYLYEDARHIMWNVYNAGFGVDVEPDSDGEAVVTYWLPREGKDIIAEIHYATRTDTVRLAWDGMMFNRQ